MAGTAYELTPDQQVELASIERRVVPQRSCGSCSMCCKVPSIPLLDKPAGKWCAHANPGSGCAIHPTRPFVCRSFYCHWMLTPGLGPEWKPDIAKFAIFMRNGGTRITAHVDPGSPGAWKRPPYYSTLKSWSVIGAAQRPKLHLIDVMVGERVTVILPDRDVDIGIVGENETIQLALRPNGTVDLQIGEGVTPPAA
jgi:hypothetical protein